MSDIKELDEQTTTQLLKGIDIPPQPQVLRVVMAEQQQKDPDLRKIAAAVAKDVGLSAAMLRAANSPAFGLRQKATSISQAVMLLGMGNTVSLVTGLSLRMVMSGKGKIRLERFWDTASDTAMICSVLARRFKIMAADQAHMLGLFHDCGIPLLMQRFPNYVEVLRKANADTQEPITSIEDRHFNTNHAVIGYLVGRSWFLSEEIREIIHHHHDEAFLSNPHDEVLASRISLLILAEYLCHLYHRESDDVVWQRVGSNVMQLLDLNETTLQELNEDVKDLLSS
ncbi:HDOD domain-containing protein [Gammaproteobacteria bacterium]